MSIKLCKWVLILLVAVLGACSPKGAQYYEELDLVYTNYNNTYDFKSKVKFAIPDSVIKITGNVFQNPGTGKPAFVSPVYGNTIIAELKKNMQAYGWTLVDKNN